MVALFSAAGALYLVTYGPWAPSDEYTKLEELSDMIQARFIGQEDVTAMEDAAAEAMVDSLGDRWSYYISKADYAAYLDTMSNSYVGIGITISEMEDGYFQVKEVTSGSPAEDAGIQVGDVLIGVEGLDCAELGMTETRNIVRGEEGTQVNLTIRRGMNRFEISVTRAYFETPVAEYEMLSNRIGLVTIFNFDDRCASESIAAIEELLDQGAEALIFDVRNNPGGYKTELVELLDYLLPEGPLFRSEFYDGSTEVLESDSSCLDIPFAVLVNAESYSAAEFFAAALSEYDAAIVVGEQTVGKGYFQQTYQLNDGSAVGLSIGRYFTPNGKSLADVGITPDVIVEVDDETFWEIYYGTLPSLEDPQILAAIDALK